MQHIKLLIAALATSLLLSSVNGPDAQPRARKLGKEQKVDEYGYAIRIIERWASIPQKAEETQIVGSWKPEMKDIQLRGDYSAMGCELKVVRFRTPGAVTGSAEEKEAEQKKREDEKRRADFAPLHVGEGAFTEALLLQHEDELARLDGLMEKREGIVKIAEKREEIVAVRFVEARVATAKGDAENDAEGTAFEEEEHVGYLLTKREEGGLLGGLWEFPSARMETPNEPVSASSAAWVSAS